MKQRRSFRRPSQVATAPVSPTSRRDRLAVLLALAALVTLAAVFLFARNTQFLMPGPLSSAHGAIEACSACHTSSGSGNFSWVRGLVAGDRLADSKACVSCHKMPETAFDSHGAAAEILRRSTLRLTKAAAQTPAPISARAQHSAFPAGKAVKGGLACATCHQEHQGAGFDLKKISNEKCQSCHVVKFDSFDGHHPEFENFPFRRRTRVVFDHTGHFGKHFPETATKTPTKAIPTACSSCHSSEKDRRVMAVAPFEQTCSGCHLDQITGKERISGPKGVAFLSLPGLDLETLRKKKIKIGEWPDASEAALTPFMKVLIARTKTGRDILKKVAGLNLQELGRANNEQIKAVGDLVWEIKGLYYALIKGQASDVLAELEIGGVKLGVDVIAELTASFPRDVVVGAQLQWLPNLGIEMAGRPDAGEQRSGKVNLNQASIDEPAGAKAGRSVGAVPEASATPDKPVAKGRPPQRAADQTDDLLFPTEEERRAMKGGVKGEKRAAQPREPQAKPLAPPSKAEGATPAAATAKTAANTPTPPARAVPVVGIESQVEPENWAAYGGWYRQDNAIFYRPVGHKDKLIFTWLRLAGPVAPQGDVNPIAAVFDSLTGKEAQGSCTKCHSIDAVVGKGRNVNFSPATSQDKHGRFTNFIHEPHFSIFDKRGCLTCHALEKSSPYLKSYEASDPQTIAPNFSPVKKETCQTCHNSSSTRQDCGTCHAYHLHGPIAPIMSTRIPME